MPPQFVLDASVALAWFFPDSTKNHAYAFSVFDYIRSEGAIAVVPDLFHYEVGSFLIRRRRDKAARFGAAKLAGAIGVLNSFEMIVHYPAITYEQVVNLAETFHVQGKDVPYVSLARSEGLPIATLDRGIRSACRELKIEALSFS